MTHGACASGDLYSTQAGCALLEAGGNAVDAAVGAALAACVSLPTMSSLGGGGLFTLLVDGRVTVCDHFSTVPGLGLKKRGQRELDLVTVNFEGISVDFRVRAPSIAVPGTVAGLWEVHLRHGRLPLSEVAAPALALAREGFAVTGGQRRAFTLLDEIFRMTPEAWALLSNGDEVAEVGETLRNVPLADTIACLVEEGPAAFYEGDIARAIVGASEEWLTSEDLAAYAAQFREPLEGFYRGWTLRMAAMPSVTGGMLLAALRHLETGAPLPRTLGVEGTRRLAESMRRAQATRTPEYESRLFEDGYLQGLFAGCPGGNTMQISTADEDGNLVSYTTSVGESAGVTAPGTGVILNNFLGEEDILPAGGLRAAGRRMMTSMCPLVMSNGHGTRVALGSAGSARIKSAILQVVTNVIDRGMPLHEAVLAPRIHVEDETLYVEGHGRTEAEVDALRPLSKAFEATTDCGFFFGGAQAVLQGPGGFQTGADEERRGCVAQVV
jgi:gamma-glutamyltranspeptidase/glutathione hydrolase